MPHSWALAFTTQPPHQAWDPQAAAGTRRAHAGPGPVLTGSHITEQNLDWPVSREPPSLLRSRTKMASFPYCEYHTLRLLLR